ncbi:hypothetical protein ACHAXR_001730, partial [Thalassiosira sp. AJA248-18]
MKVVSLLASSICIAFHLQQPSSAFTRQPTTSLCYCFRPRQRLHGRLRHLNRNVNVHSTLGSFGLGASATLLENDEQTLIGLRNGEPDVDRRPHEQRVSGPRKARRLNHPFQHLYRHSDPRWEDNDWNDTVALSDEVYEFYRSRMSGNETFSDHAQSNNSTFAQQPIDVKTSLSAIQYLHLHGGYTFEEIQSMHAKFPPLLEMDVIRHLRPKMRFLKDCLGGASHTEQVLVNRLKFILPANFFGARFERTIAPRHAFLVHVGLPSGKTLWDETYKSDVTNKGGSASLLEEFLLMHRKPKQFSAMCNKWRNLYGSEIGRRCNTDKLPITSEEVLAFDKSFQRGILSAARDDFVDGFPGEGNGNKTKSINNTPSMLQTANVTSAQLIQYLIQHGANPWETDVRGASLFHWAAGCGNLEGLQELVDGCDRLESRLQARGTNNTSSPKNPGVHAALLWKASRDDATPLHWAVAGAAPKEF